MLVQSEIGSHPALTKGPLATGRSYAVLNRRAAITGLAISALAAPHVARAATRRVRFGHNNTDDSHFGRGAQEFANAVAADPALRSVLKIDVLGNAQLGDDLTMLAGCAKGTIDGALIGGSLISSVVPEMGILNAPYLFGNVGHARAVLEGPIGAEFMKLACAKNLPVLAWGENGQRHISSNKAVRTVADLKALKLRWPLMPKKALKSHAKCPTRQPRTVSSALKVSA